MGCDYYTWIETVIEYTNEKGETVEYVEKPEFEQYEKHYEFHSDSYDSDLDNPPEDSLTLRKRSYGEKILYNGNRWVCLEAGITRVTKVLAGQNIPLDKVVRIFKRMGGYWR